MSISGKVGKFSFVPSHKSFFESKGQYFARGAKTPQMGDIVIFRNESHIGLVEYVSGGDVHTIEGNTSSGNTLVANGGGVFQKAYNLSSTYIMGYGRPNWAAGEAEKFVAIAKAEVGYLEKASNSQLDSKTANAGSANYNKYARDIWPAFQAQPWCDIFVSWCAIQADKGTAAVVKTTKYFSSPKTYRNGSTDEICYADTGLTERTGSLNPWESCRCLAIVNGRYLVEYDKDGTSDRKTGFVEYDGGITT